MIWLWVGHDTLQILAKLLDNGKTLEEEDSKDPHGCHVPWRDGPEQGTEGRGNNSEVDHCRSRPLPEVLFLLQSPRPIGIHEWAPRRIFAGKDPSFFGRSWRVQVRWQEATHDLCVLRRLQRTNAMACVGVQVSSTYDPVKIRLRTSNDSRSESKVPLTEMLQPLVEELNALTTTSVSVMAMDGLEANAVRGLVTTCGLFSCARCLARGTTATYKKVHFPLGAENYEAEERTTEMIADMIRIIEDEDLPIIQDTRERRKGVKQRSPFLDLREFDLIHDIPIDVMHIAHLGITKRIWEKMSSTVLAFSASARSQVISDFDRVFKQTKVPSELPRTRSINISKFKARHWQVVDSFCFTSFALQIRYPQRLRKILLLYNFVVRALYSSDEIFNSLDADQIMQRSVQGFLEEYSGLFTPGALTFNLHGFSHLLDVRRRHGPVHKYSTNKYESMYAETRYSYYPNTPSIPKQILQVSHYERDMNQ